MPVSQPRARIPAFCRMLHDVAWCCMMLHDFAGCCMRLHVYCVMLIESSIAAGVVGCRRLALASTIVIGASCCRQTYVFVLSLICLASEVGGIVYRRPDGIDGRSRERNSRSSLPVADGDVAGLPSSYRHASHNTCARARTHTKHTCTRACACASVR